MTAPADMSLDIEGLTHVYANGVVALDDLCVRVGAGVFGLLGPNGAGKTTLMEILALRRKPSAGVVRFGEVDLLGAPGAFRTRLGYLPQDFDFHSRTTVAGALGLFARLFGLGARQARGRIDEVLARTNLTALAHRRLGALSGGEKRRFGIAQAILNFPALLIVDEPTSGLDAQERLAFHDVLLELGRDRVVLLSTHLVRDVQAVCERVAVLHHGRLIFHDRVEELVRRAEGKTWEFPAESEAIDRLADEGRLVSVREDARGFAVRAVSATPPAPDARRVAPGMEDAYISLVGGEGRGGAGDVEY
jgi:ABC-2 type transport system ATP-binding protein